MRTRPELDLKRREYSPKIIRLWKKTRKRLAALPRGQLAVQSEPAGAEVVLDGQKIGVTPYIGRLPQGSYHLRVNHADAGAAARRIEIAGTPVRFRFQLSFEGALALDLAHPAVRLPAGQDRLPAHWWPWLGDRLGLRFLVAVRRYQQDGRPYLAAALVDLERGSRVREGWLELAASGPADLDQYAADLADFLVTGKAAGRLQVQSIPSIATLDPLADSTETPTATTSSQVPDLPIHFAPRPWHRKWWPYATGAAVTLGLGLGATLAASHFDTLAQESSAESARKSNQDSADTWQAISITGYALTATIATTGLILYLTHRPQEIFPETGSIVPMVNDNQMGLVWVGRF